MNTENKVLRMELGDRSYDITIGNGLLSAADKYMNLKRKVLIVTDSGVPKEYSNTIANLCDEAKIFIFPQGEKSKNLDTYANICKEMLSFGLQRKDAVIAVGGGVTGDMAGFAAATYMRGVDFYNIPTTLLSEVDSSIGGKTAIDFCGVKNIIGAFYQPKAVLIDTDTLKTLDKRQFASGLSEVTKMALTSDKELFEMMERGLYKTNITEVIYRALLIKKDVVENDEREGGLRKILNFGHTFGHGVESLGKTLHGESVAIGMIPMASTTVRERLVPLLKEMGLPTKFDGDIDKALEIMKHDKKGDGNATHVVFVDEVGTYRLKKISFEELSKHIKNNI